ncbi:DUF1684 domain-containing protein [Pareuzebyella sediminis]|uniref:DUF1684 domain-containing protein n=1 Tax=Pareuzebyella sediminis TaxID=2607998 RepID=UPI0011EF803C|nr:DUF1684 domain-containing protein [Pareuzebyella sediminis]
MRYLILVVLCLIGCKEEKKYHDRVQDKIEMPKTEVLADILKFQSELNAEYKNPETSPLPDRYRMNFEGIDFFPPDTTYSVTARFERTPEALPFLMPTTTERKSKEVVYGRAYFTLKGKEYRLEIYQNQELMLQEKYRDYLFLPFTDLTNGQETYDGGRYIDLTIPKGDSIRIDFNKAYNPYCAYNKKYSCPIVPSVNALNTEVLAGVKAFKPGEN